VTQREAKRIVCRDAAAILGAGCTIGLDHARSREDERRLSEAMDELVQELARRGRHPDATPATLRPEDQQPQGAVSGCQGFWRR